ncbi:hypothetical protein TCAL_12971 [Tigriopus californicus]|uniref:NAD(P)-binding domain-containing protein n=2 Tax=Tigriopus californicus TaxID=6832 RepID=A0A553PJU8_TIGCA|nr:uncharacterized protein YwnB-like isoform X2 [Tigriopus californicus]TRY77957.1 hypothetical protein TCAL_12971 [Tigriopus californicus]
MKIAVLGATGQTGMNVVSQALDKGHSVKAIVRTPAKMTITHANLEVVEGNIFSAESLQEHFKDVDAVISTLGFSPFTRPVTGYLNATKAMVTALKSCEKKRLLLMHSWYTQPQSQSKAPFFIRWFLFTIIGSNLTNMYETEQYLESDECQDINYSVILPGGLSNAAVTNTPFLAKEDEYDIKGNGSRIARADVARYLIKTAEEDLHHRKVVSIALDA